MLISHSKHLLSFQKPAKTSRGEYLEKPSWLINLGDGVIHGTGEASPLWDLSIDGNADIDTVLSLLPDEISESDFLSLLESWEPGTNCALPSIRFAFHTAYLDYKSGGTGIWVNNDFTHKKVGIPINGLVWMNTIEAMEEEALTKIKQGFRCIKFKIGALDFDAECRLLERIRSKYSAFELEIRLDANGALGEDTALEQLKELHRFSIHSMEQPIRAGLESMEKICRESSIDIALDEELIGIAPAKGKALITRLKPRYLILKPTLLGGLDLCDRWIQVAETVGCGWWSTSALEGNVGLFAIAQWVSQKPNIPYQGLGTGALFMENFPSNTEIRGEYLWRK
ncbi:MAG: o-succinylbenzoate synthase [Bacteroidota bacterium]|jgi:L-alanine-DL-glutamate epimerase-like enolase superfamily enzyme